MIVPAISHHCQRITPSQRDHRIAGLPADNPTYVCQESVASPRILPLMEAIHHLKRLDEDELYLAFKSALLDGHSEIYAADTTGLLHLAGASQLIQPVPYQNPPIQYRQSYVEEPNEVTGQQIDILA